MSDYNPPTVKDDQIAAVSNATQVIRLLEVIEHLLLRNGEKPIGPGWRGMSEDAAALRRVVTMNRLDIIEDCGLESFFPPETLQKFKAESELAYRQHQ